MNQTMKNMLAFCLSFLIALILVTLLVGCGYQRTLRTHCHLGDTQTCDAIFGVNQTEIDEQQSAQLSAQQKEIDSLSTQVDGLIADVRVVELDISRNATMLLMLESIINLNQGDIALIKATIESMQLDQTALEEKVAYEQTRILALQSDLAALASQDSINEAILPCGDRVNKFDEAILKMKSGKLIAYFENGGARHLTILTPGSYRTTDSAPYCYFNVNSAGQIEAGVRR